MVLTSPKNAGFTLIELSIVLLIISLITGGIVAGRSLAHSARLTSLADDVNKYQTAARAFEITYHGLPGDITNATEYWPGQTYSGNGDGKINSISQGGTGAADDGTDITEDKTVFEQLSLAGVIPGTYNSASEDLNFPESAIEGGYFLPKYTSREQEFGCVGLCSAPQKNLLSLSKIGIPAVLSPPDARTVDMKIDDGKPGTGNVTVSNQADCTDKLWYWEMNVAKYELEYQTPKCAMIFNIN